MTFTTFIFDFDGTLADSKECSVRATQTAFQAFGLTVPTVEQIEFYMGIPIEHSFKEMSDQPLTPEEFEQLLILFRQKYQALEADTLHVFAGIPEALAALKAQHKKLFVVSSKKSNVLLRNLEMLAISEYFTEVIGSDKVSRFKPHPDGILDVLQRYQIANEQAVYIGDAIFDLQMAHAADVAACAVTWGSHSPEALLAEKPMFVVEKVAELTQIG